MANDKIGENHLIYRNNKADILEMINHLIQSIKMTVGV